MVDKLQAAARRMERYKKSRAEAETQIGTVHRELAVHSQLFTNWVEWGWLDKRPANIKRYVEASSRITYLIVDQIKRLIDAAKQDQNPQIYLFIVVGLETSMWRMESLRIRREHVDVQRRVIYIPHAQAGTRRGTADAAGAPIRAASSRPTLTTGELLALRWEDIDLRRGMIVLHNTKNGQRRTLPLIGHALDAMRQHAKVRRIDSPLVFPDSTGTQPASIREACRYCRFPFS